VRLTLAAARLLVLAARWLLTLPTLAGASPARAGARRYRTAPPAAAGC